MARVVILGAGISGHTAALHLRRLPGRGRRGGGRLAERGLELDPAEHLGRVGRMPPEAVTFPLAPVFRRQGIEFRQAKAVAIWPGGG
jgi:sulfide:quinone oxidoreductase